MDRIPSAMRPKTTVHGTDGAGMPAALEPNEAATAAVNSIALSSEKRASAHVRPGPGRNLVRVWGCRRRTPGAEAAARFATTFEAPARARAAPCPGWPPESATDHRRLRRGRDRRR